MKSCCEPGLEAHGCVFSTKGIGVRIMGSKSAPVATGRPCLGNKKCLLLFGLIVPHVPYAKSESSTPQRLQPGTGGGSLTSTEFRSNQIFALQNRPQGDPCPFGHRSSHKQKASSVSQEPDLPRPKSAGALILNTSTSRAGRKAFCHF